MSVYLFGYGSLMNVESASRALRREVRTTDLIPAYLNGFIRSWTLKERVHAEALDREITALFLDLDSKPGIRCNGVLFEISDEHLEGLDRREKNYDRIDVSEAVSASIRTDERPTYTFIAKPQFKAEEGETGLFIMDRYVALVETACTRIGAKFADDYIASTRPILHPRLGDGYVFIDPEQAKYV